VRLGSIARSIAFKYAYDWRNRIPQTRSIKSDFLGRRRAHTWVRLAPKFSENRSQSSRAAYRRRCRSSRTRRDTRSRFRPPSRDRSRASTHQPDRAHAGSEANSRPASDPPRSTASSHEACARLPRFVAAPTRTVRPGQPLRRAELFKHL
jgi:hypothetical protein